MGLPPIDRAPIRREGSGVVFGALTPDQARAHIRARAAGAAPAIDAPPAPPAGPDSGKPPGKPPAKPGAPGDAKNAARLLQLMTELGPDEIVKRVPLELLSQVVDALSKKPAPEAGRKPGEPQPERDPLAAMRAQAREPGTWREGNTLCFGMIPLGHGGAK